MSPPKPPVALSGHCSVINDNVLYVYSPDAFQSIPLQEGGQWAQIPMGVSTTGASCVLAAPPNGGGGAAMYVVGGAANASQSNYPGLQRYSFSDKTWETITPLVQVTKNRQNHAAVYLNDSSSILVYAGSQNGDDGPSSQTFVISTNSPYSVDAFNSDAPPAVAPLLMPWNSSSAVMVGGGSQNTEVFTFDPAAGWKDLNVTLQQALPDDSKAQCTLVTGDDGSKVLETYDMSVSPNAVSRVALLGANGQPASSGQTVGSSTASSSSSPSPSPAKRRRRDLTLKDWPAYNNTLAPTATRTGFSLAQGDNGLAVISGGDDQDPICIFNQRQNSWVDANQLFGGDDHTNVHDASATPSSSTTPTSTTSPTATTTTAAIGTSHHTSRSKDLTILGAVLGSLLGVALLCIIALLFIKWKRNKNRPGTDQAAGDEKDRMSFVDRGVSFMSGEQGAPSYSHVKMDSMASQTSMAIISGRAADGHKRELFGKGSGGAKAALFKQKDPSTPERGRGVNFAAGSAQPRTNPLSRSRSSGWSKYFAGNSATNLATLEPSRRSIHSYGSHSSQGSQSQLTDSHHARGPIRPQRPSIVTPNSDEAVPRFNFGRFSSGQDHLSEVSRGSPTIGHSPTDFKGAGLAVSDGLTAQLSRPGSADSISDISSIDDPDAFSSGVPASVQEEVHSWTPIQPLEWRTSSNGDRATSSVYTESSYDIMNLPRQSNVTPNTSNNMLAPPTLVSSHHQQLQQQQQQRDSSSTTLTRFPYPGGQPQGGRVTPLPGGANSHNSSSSNVGSASGGMGVGAIALADYGARDTRESDMSWLNLGGSRD
ncbi:MAG: hypothetical protein M1819_000206 [Sarea resinae]|nr:MAG: hypothetical protein M1819_000206 [Sarea resinae]